VPFRIARRGSVDEPTACLQKIWARAMTSLWALIISVAYALPPRIALETIACIGGAGQSHGRVIGRAMLAL